ncbi:MAG: hypothetical protein QM689_11780 [Oscillospiraceae bacterium]
MMSMKTPAASFEQSLYRDGKPRTSAPAGKQPDQSQHKAGSGVGHHAPRVIQQRGRNRRRAFHGISGFAHALRKPYSAAHRHTVDRGDNADEKQHPVAHLRLCKLPRDKQI